MDKQTTKDIIKQGLLHLRKTGTSSNETRKTSKRDVKQKMMTHEQIFKIIQFLPPGVGAIFFLINVIKGNTMAMLVIGLCLIAFIGIPIFTQKRNIELYKRELILALALPILVFIISLFSGESYSDDFPMFLAIIGMTGLFLEPQFTKAQIIFVDILFVLMYIIHPEKAGEKSQYIMCLGVFTMAAILFYQVIKRGRAFIQISNERARESEKLLDSIREMGISLQKDFDISSSRIEASTVGLHNGSLLIAKGADEVSDSCSVVHNKILDTQDQVGLMNEEVHKVEIALSSNRDNLNSMGIQISSVEQIIDNSSKVFGNMESKMKQISGIAKQINDIAFKLTIISLNASVEAAHAGDFGLEFNVIAEEMRELSETSGKFAEKVSDVVKELSASVEDTAKQFSGSAKALDESQKVMEGLIIGFEDLSEQFNSLYSNIETQNQNVHQIDQIFTELNQKVADMQASSATNQNAVDGIVVAMADYKETVSKVVENTQTI